MISDLTYSGRFHFNCHSLFPILCSRNKIYLFFPFITHLLPLLDLVFVTASIEIVSSKCIRRYYWFGFSLKTGITEVTQSVKKWITQPLSFLFWLDSQHWKEPKAKVTSGTIGLKTMQVKGSLKTGYFQHFRVLLAIIVNLKELLMNLAGSISMAVSNAPREFLGIRQTWLHRIAQLLVLLELSAMRKA